MQEILQDPLLASLFTVHSLNIATRCGNRNVTTPTTTQQELGRVRTAPDKLYKLCPPAVQIAATPQSTLNKTTLHRSNEGSRHCQQKHTPIGAGVLGQNLYSAAGNMSVDTP